MIEEMKSTLFSLYDFAVSKGLLQREREFGQQLQATIESFLALAKASAEDSHDEKQEDSSKNDDTGARRSNGQKGSPKRNHDESWSVSEPLVSEPPSTYRGHILAKDETTEMDITYTHEDHYRNNQCKVNQFRVRPSDIQIITQPTGDNIIFPFGFMDLQPYRDEVPSIDEFSQHFLPLSQPKPPKSYSYNELSLSRQIHRLSIEKCFRLFTSDDPATEERIQSVFRFSLMYSSREDIAARLHQLVCTSAKDTLHHWCAPFVHIGGAGTHYPINESDENWELMPRFRTGYSMGPFTTTVSEAQELLDDQMRCTLPGFEGYLFDPNDVEGYLRDRGLDIAPAADSVEVELEALGIPDSASLKSTSSNSVASKDSRPGLKSPVEAAPFDVDKFSDAFALDPVDERYGDINPVTQYLLFPLGFNSWEDGGSAEAGDDSIDYLFKLDQSTKNSLAELSSEALRNDKKCTVTINVNVLIDGTSCFIMKSHKC